MSFSNDGYEWTPEGGLKTGLPTDAVIDPPKLLPNPEKEFDVIVVGAGYAGLRALRDLSIQGYKVLLLEGRDRIGGRSWTVKKDGYVYEVGGTWIHRNQAQVWAEAVRYGLDDKLKDSMEFYEGSREPTVNRDGVLIDIPFTDEAVITGYEKFTNIDGQCGNSVYALNTSQWLDNEEFSKWDHMSCQDRLDQIRDTLTPEEHEAILGTLFSMTKGPMTRPSFGEILRWSAISGGSIQAFGDHAARWKFADGQTALARSMFDDACSSGNLSYSFKTPVSRISTEANMITVTANSGSSFVAQHVIVAIPLNCLKDITFDPALPPLKAEASVQGHSNHAYKVCIEVAGKDWRNWQGHAFPDKGIPFLIGDGITPQGNSYLITTPGDYINPQQEPEKLLDALQYLHPDLKIQRIFGCDYFSDPFSKGGWAVHSPGFVMKYLKALQAPVSNIHFASADWADLWRGFIDGALESGARAVSAIHLQRAAA
ncbi:monoamine oxidase N [Colletotrichum chrysophilum]|uniref:Amine oxidase n=1 Tax=Colletotrichum chrysophilum TaxID=1836956 RepID=A0AAD9ESU4_9PEZI|nr:monoamine oxidase N [Colletotrichum chrysophilum]